MKKLLIILLLASCTKQQEEKTSQKCYICTFGATGGAAIPDKEICGQDPAEFLANFTDANGNKPGGTCKPKQ